MKFKIIFISLLVVAVTGIGFLIASQESSSFKTPSPQVSSDDVNTKKWERKSDTQVNITVEVTPTNLLPQSKEWKFKVVLDTHLDSLDQDMTKVAVLVDDQGKEYLPKAWTGDGSGGHHREGVLSFNAIVPIPNTVELRIKEVGKSTLRVFNWQIANRG